MFAIEEAPRYEFCRSHFNLALNAQTLPLVYFLLHKYEECLPFSYLKTKRLKIWKALFIGAEKGLYLELRLHLMKRLSCLLDIEMVRKLIGL